MKKTSMVSTTTLCYVLVFLCAPLFAVRARAVTTYAATNVNRLLSFDSATPGTLEFDVPISGVGNGEAVIGLDVRPANAKLYAVTRDNGGVGRIYIINTVLGAMTGTATPVSTITATLASTSFGAYGIDFDPLNDRLRLVNDIGQNLRIDVDSGATIVDTPLAFASGDSHAGVAPRVIAAAYDDAGRLFDYAFDDDLLVRQNPPNAGTLTTIGDAIVRATGPVKLDIERNTGHALASLVTSTTDYSLYNVNLTTGAFERIGRIGFSALVIRGLAIAVGQTFVVNSSADSDDGICDATDCTLREAISAANAKPGRDVINFNIPGAGVHSIALAERLPLITEALVIDGTTQPGATPNTLAKGTNANLRIELDGTNLSQFLLPNSIRVAASDCVIKGLIVNNFRSGAGIYLLPRTRNSVVEGNFIGTDATGTVAKGNGGGIYVSGSDSVIGGVTPAARNLISGNGTDNSNGLGIAIFGDSSSDLATGNRVLGNIIGTDASGEVALGNRLAGVNILDNTSGNSIGSAASANTIAFNGGDGVLVTGSTSTSNAIVANRIFGNSGLGINLQPAGEAATTVTPNDNGDADSGPNALQNFPVLNRVVSSGGTRTLEGSLNSTPNTRLTLDFYSSQNADASGNGEGQDYLGALEVTTDNDGNVDFSYPINNVAVNRFVTATATNFNSRDTSEFSNALLAALQGSVQFFNAAFTVDEGAGTATITVTRIGGSDGAVSVDYATSDGSATAGSDYTSTSGTLNFADGQISATFTISIVDDALDEDDETLNLTLSNPLGGATLGAPASATLTIIDNDAKPTLIIEAAKSVREGDSGTTPVTFTVTASAPSSKTMRVTYSTVEQSATAPGDYAATAGTLVFAPGETAKTITVQVKGDTIAEGNETFLVQLGSVENAFLQAGASNGVATILDDETAALALSVAPSTFSEAAGATAATGTLTRNTPVDSALTVNLLSSNSGKVAVPASVIIPAGQATVNFFLSAVDNALVDGPQNISISASSTGLISATATVTVTDDDVPANSAPVAIAQQLRLDNATPLAITLSATDVDNDALSFAVVSGPQNGTLSGDAPNLVYAANAGFVGSDSFTFTASDGKAISQPATITLIVGGDAAVAAANDDYNLILGAPGQAQQSGVVLLSSGVFQIQVPGVLTNDSFASTQTLTVRALSNPQNGRFQLRNDGTLFYLPSTGKVGVDEFNYSISDGKTTATARVRLNVFDRRAPELRFDKPSDRATVSSIGEIRGRVRDRQSGLKSLTLIWRRFDGAYWNGSAWTTNATELPLTVQGIDWKYTGPSPVPGTDRAKNLLDGRYDLRVSATDQSGNVSRVTNRLTVDNAAPQLQIVQPIASSATSADINSATPILGLDAISGRTRDANGVARVELVLRRASDGAYWNGRSFTSAPARFPAQLAPNGDWKADANTPVKIPTLEQLKLGAYLISAHAYDRLGNEAKAEVAIQIVQTNSSGA